MNDFSRDDRLRSAGLPSTLSSDALRRIAARVGLGEAPQPKVAHPVWALQPAGDDEEDGVVLVRRREERLVDLRAERAAQAQAAAFARQAAAYAALAPGQRVRAVRQGQIADAVIMMVHPEVEAVDLLFSSDGEADHVPVEMIVLDDEPSDDASMDGLDDFEDEYLAGGEEEFLDDAVAEEVDPNDPFDVELGEMPREPLEEDAGMLVEQLGEYVASRRRWSRRTAAAWADLRPDAEVVVTRPFRPFFVPAIEVPAGAVFVVDGFHHASSDEYMGYGDLPLADEQAGPQAVQNLRIRLSHPETGGQLLVTPDEFADDFEGRAVASDGTEDVNEMPGESTFGTQDTVLRRTQDTVVNRPTVDPRARTPTLPRARP